MKDKELQSGYYWVRSITKTPQIGYWDGYKWTVCGNHMEFIGFSILTPINENRIPSPDESSTVFAGTMATGKGFEPIFITLPIGVTLDRYMEAVKMSGAPTKSPEQEALEFIAKHKR